jgi:diguanylate cyclase (GGDEF)-like protein/PAS domain S-box-containing protein
MDAVLEIFDRERAQHLDAETLDRMLTLVLAEHPDAIITTMRAEGVIVPVPDSMPVPQDRVADARSGLDIVVYDATLFAAWDRALAQGAARCQVHPVSRPDITGQNHLLDVREKHGVIVAVTAFDASEMSDDVTAELSIPDIKPRFTTVRKDATSVIVRVDEAITRILGWSAEEMEGQRSIEFIHPDDHSLAVDNWMEMLSSAGLARRVRLRHRHRDGSWVWFEITNHNLLADPDHGYVVSEMVDISEEMAAHEVVRAREQLLDRLAGAVPVGLVQLDADRNVVYTNERLHQILGVGRADTADEQLATVIDADRPALAQALDALLGEGVEADIEVQLRLTTSGALRSCTVSLRALSLEDGTISGAIACVADVTDSARMRDELKRRATFDRLTGCYNRESIMLALEANIERGDRGAERAVVFVDVDRFKGVNDEHGHAVGDEVLRVVARRLQRAVRDGDVVGRIGGDEFLVVCPDIGGRQQAMRLAERLAHAVRREMIPVATGSVPAQISVGVAWSTGDARGADAMVALADNAMYESKREGAGHPKLAIAA